MSTKNFKAKSNLLFTFLLNDPAAPPGRYVIPTDEFENFELDPVKRKIYHIDRNDITTTSSNREKQPLKLLEIDADDFNFIQSTDIKHKCTGSLNHALFGSLGVLIASCENNYLFSIDLDSIDILATICPNQYISIIADTLNNLVYLDLGSHTMEARDAKTLALRKSVAGPYYAEKMSISYNRKELYVPAGYESEVWVYSIPDLNLKKKIKTQFGQRALAVDEKNNLLIAASGITGYIDVIDLDSEKRLQRHYVAKYGRTLILDTDRRNAFMTTTNDGLFMLKY